MAHRSTVYCDFKSCKDCLQRQKNPLKEEEGEYQGEFRYHRLSYTIFFLD